MQKILARTERCLEQIIALHLFLPKNDFFFFFAFRFLPLIPSKYTTTLFRVYTNMLLEVSVLSILK